MILPKPGPAELPQAQQAGDLTASPHVLGWGGQDGGQPSLQQNLLHQQADKKQACFVGIISGC